MGLFSPGKKKSSVSVIRNDKGYIILFKMKLGSMLEKDQKKTAKQQRTNKASLPRWLNGVHAFISVLSSLASLALSLFDTFHGHLS